MRYYGLLNTAIVAIILLILVKDGTLFQDFFFGSMYILLSAAIVIGTKFRGNYRIDFSLGVFLLLSALVLLFYFVLFSPLSAVVLFQIVLLVVLGLCGVAFIRVKDRRVE